MAGKRPLKLPDGTWTYPNSAEVLVEVELKTIAHYIGVRRQHVANYIVNKPIFLSCVNGVRRRGSSVRQFWWMQPMNLEAVRAACLAGPVVCVLTCPPEVRVVSNTKAYQSQLDVPPPPRNLTTRIKAKLRVT
jgi:hypothetical protein